MSTMHRTWLLAATSVAVLSLGGCATTRGGPESVFDSAALVKKARGYSVEAVDEKIDGLDSDQAGQQRYRNKVIRAYLTAIDSQYFQFRSNLGLEGRGGGLGFDLLTLALATAGSLSMGAAPELAAAAGVATGSRGAITKNLLFEKTLPAIFASMDAARLRQHSRIVDKMSQSVGDYPMEEAWNDLQTYQVSGTFDDAVAQVTDRASADRAAARAAFNRANGIACDAKADIVPLRTQLGELLYAEYNKAENAATATRGKEGLARFASAFGVDVKGTNLELAQEIGKKINLDYCSPDALRQKIDLLSR